MFCDHGADINKSTGKGKNALIYSAQLGKDDIAMYLSLRTQDVNLEDRETGATVFQIYLEKQDILHMH